jgi:hypothetical protein
MRLVLALFVLAACGGKPSAPAWPKMADKEVDGGESLEPHAKAASVVEATKKDDVAIVTPATDKDKPATPKTDAETPKPATPTGTTPATEEITITTEEIVIEIDD